MCDYTTAATRGDKVKQQRCSDEQSGRAGDKPTCWYNIKKNASQKERVHETHVDNRSWQNLQEDISRRLDPCQDAILTMVPNESMKTKNLIEKQQKPQSSGKITSSHRL